MKTAKIGIGIGLFFIGLALILLFGNPYVRFVGV
jgi:hypothetical protein